MNHFSIGHKHIHEVTNNCVQPERDFAGLEWGTSKFKLLTYHRAYNCFVADCLLSAQPSPKLLAIINNWFPNLQPNPFFYFSEIERLNWDSDEGLEEQVSPFNIFFCFPAALVWHMGSSCAVGAIQIWKRGYNPANTGLERRWVYGEEIRGSA